MELFSRCLAPTGFTAIIPGARSWMDGIPRVNTSSKLKEKRRTATTRNVGFANSDAHCHGSGPRTTYPNLRIKLFTNVYREVFFVTVIKISAHSVVGCM